MVKKNIFRRFFELNIPNYDHFDYYVGLLSSLYKHRNILDNVALFEQVENEIDIESVKMEISDDIINYLKSSKAYSLFSNQTIKETDMVQLFKNGVFDEGKKYVSIDINSANYSMLKFYDKDNELKSTYEELLYSYNAPDILTKCKGMRQYIFGNLNPKKNIQNQKAFMKPLVIELASKDLVIHSVNNDEVIVEYKPDLNYLFDGCKYKIFSNEKVDYFYKQTIYNDDLSVKGYDLFSCEAADLYSSIKKHIVFEPLELSDFYFKHNNKLGLYINETTLELLAQLDQSKV